MADHSVGTRYWVWLLCPCYCPTTISACAITLCSRSSSFARPICAWFANLVFVPMQMCHVAANLGTEIRQFFGPSLTAAETKRSPKLLPHPRNPQIYPVPHSRSSISVPPSLTAWSCPNHVSLPLAHQVLISRTSSTHRSEQPLKRG